MVPMLRGSGVSACTEPYTPTSLKFPKKFPLLCSLPPVSVMPFLSFTCVSFAAIDFYIATHTHSQSDDGPARQPLCHTSRLLPSASASLHRFQHTCLSFLRSMQTTSRMYPSKHIHAYPYPWMTYSYPRMTSTTSVHMWHDPLDACENGKKQGTTKKQPTVAVVLLGWLGAKHRHLKKYADWYMSQGIHAVTFTIPMKDIFTLKAEKHVDVLTQNLIEWLRDKPSQDDEKVVIVHMFSNTGWLTYGAVLDRLTKEGDELVKKIKGCVVDSAPAAGNDSQVWASGFATALLKKKSAAMQIEHQSGDGMPMHAKPSIKEMALLAVLERMSTYVLQTPYVKQRLDHVVSVLANKQPSCPQLYIYSSADVVIPANSVETYIAEQQKAGHIVHACNFQPSPHVDHFRSFPEKYSEQLASFLRVCLPQSGLLSKCVVNC